MKPIAVYIINKIRYFLPCSLLIVLFGYAQLAQSQIEEIVVTATKRGDTLIQDIPLSVQAISGDSLRETGALDFNDYYRQIPGLSVVDQGPGDKRYIIRGITSAGAGTVGLYFDEIVVTGNMLTTDGGRSIDIKLFDMDRIEVLKGPQGTTFGSSSLSGAIRWIPASPDMSQASMDMGAGISSTRYSDGLSYTVDAMVNIPIVEDKVALRFAGIKIDNEGYIDNRFREDGNDDDTEALRGMLAVQVTDTLKFSLLGMHQDSKTHGRAGWMDQEIALPVSPSLNGGPVPKFYNTDLSDAGFLDKTNMYNVKFEYDPEWGNVIFTSSLLQRDTHLNRDASAEIEIITRLAFPADGSGQSFIVQPQNREVFTNEIRFASSWDSPFQMLIGGFRQSEERFFRSKVITVDSMTGKVTPDSISLLDRTVDTSVDEKALFGELSWDVTEQLNVTGGFRWFDFELVENAVAVTGFPGRPGGGPGPQLAFGEKDIIFKANVSYDLNDDILAYFQFAQGFRSGGPNDQTAASIAGVTIPAGFGSDSVDSYEVGFKSAWADSKFILNGSFFYVDWTDIQARQQASAPGGLTFSYRGNGGTAEVIGFEVQAQAYPAEGLSFGATFNYSEAELTADAPIPSNGMDGDTIPHVPEVTFNLNGRYERPLGWNNWTGFISGDFSWVDDQVNKLRPTFITYREMDSYSILNLRAGVDGDGWSAVLSIDNVLDEDETLAYIFNGGNQPSRLGLPGWVPPGMVRPWPRMVSFSVRKSFDF